MMNGASYTQDENFGPDNLLKKSYQISLAVMKDVVPFIGHGDDTRKRLSRSAKIVPRLIAAGIGNSLEPARQQHTLSEAALHCREAVVMLSFCRDLHARYVNSKLCADLINAYVEIANELGIMVGNRVKKGVGK